MSITGELKFADDAFKPTAETLKLLYGHERRRKEMSITDELRKWVKTLYIPCSDELKREAERIADRIDTEHERLMGEQYKSLTIDMQPMTDENMAKGGWVRLPVDADGVPIHVGDKLTDGEYTFVVDELAAFGDGSWSIRNEDGSAWAACDVTHHHEPTVEDMLIKMLEEAVGYSDAHTTVAYSAIAEYAERIREAVEHE